MPRADDSDPLLAAFVEATTAESAPGRAPSSTEPWSRQEVAEAMTGSQPMVIVEDPQSRLHWTALPPLPRPHYAAMRSQACGGVSVVMCIIVMCVGGTHFFVKGLTGTPFILLSAAVWGEAVLAVLCLFGLMFGNPGVIERSEQNCSPVPDGQIRELLLAGQPLPLRSGNIHGEKGSFCTRCLVWRAPSLNAHHCSTCNRCVCHFDHHCGVFGRCIAGKGFGGNMGYFKTIIAMGGIGIATAMAASVIGADDQNMTPPGGRTHTASG